MNYGVTRSLVFDHYALLIHGTPATARITGRDLGMRQDGYVYSGPTPNVTCRFTVHGRAYAHTQSVTVRRFDSLPLKTQVDIVYVPRDPHVSALAGSVTLATVLLPALSLAAADAALATIWLSLRRASRQGRVAGTRRRRRGPAA